MFLFIFCCFNVRFLTDFLSQSQNVNFKYNAGLILTISTMSLVESFLKNFRLWFFIFSLTSWDVVQHLLTINLDKESTILKLKKKKKALVNSNRCI